MTTTDDSFLVDPDAFDDELQPELDTDPVPGPDTIMDAGPSDLDMLRADLRREVVEEIVLPVPARPGYATRHAADLNAHTVEQLRKRAKTKTGIDGVKLVSLLMASTNTAVLKDGKRLTTPDGDPLNFRSSEFLEIMGEATAAGAVRKFYGRDGDMDAASRALMQACGWGVDLEAVDEDSPFPPRG